MVQILVKQQQLNCCVFFTVLKQLKERNLIMPTFIELTLCKQGHKWNAVINLDDIARFSEGPNNLTMRTPFATGDYDVTVVSEDAERLTQALLNHNQER